MRIEENSFTSTHYSGKLGPIIGDRTDVANYQMQKLGECAFISIIAGDLHASIMVRSLPHLLNFYRDLGAVLDDLQPGLVSPLPDGDKNEVDAMKVIYEADRLQREDK